MVPPSPRSRFSRAIDHLDCAVLGVCAVAVVLVAARASGGIIDDALITLTYAKNIALGNGPVYNAGAPTFGTTSPAQLCFSALLGWIFSPARLPLAAAAGSALWLAAAALLARVFHARFGLSPLAATFTGLLWFGLPFYYQGGEAAMFLGVLLAALLVWERGRPLVFGAVIGLLFLVRGEGAILGAIWGAELAGRCLLKRGAIGRDLLAPAAWAALGFAAAAGPWCVYAYATFGAALPNTLAVKVLMGGAEGTARFAGGLIADAATWGTSLLAGLRWVLWPLAAHGLCVALWRSRAWRRYVCWAAVYAMAYAAMGVMDAERYHVPLQFLWLSLVGISLAQGAEAVLCRMPGRLARPLSVAVALAMALFCMRFPLENGAAVSDPRAKAYLEMADWIRVNAPPPADIATREVGYLGFYTDNPIVDLDGLVDPELVPFAVAGDRDAIFGMRPCVLFADVFVRGKETILPRIRIGNKPYRLVNAYEGPAGWPLAYALYIRTDVN